MFKKRKLTQKGQFNISRHLIVIANALIKHIFINNGEMAICFSYYRGSPICHLTHCDFPKALSVPQSSQLLVIWIYKINLIKKLKKLL